MNIINKLNQQTFPVIYLSKRFARKRHWKNWKNDWLPFKWVRPDIEQGFFSTGDRIEKIEKFDNLQMPKAHAKAIEEVGDVPLEIKNLLTYEYYRRYDNTKEFRESKVFEKTNSSLGLESYRGKVVNYTYKIRKGRKILREDPNDVASKKNVVFWNSKRTKVMIELSKIDMDGYKKLLKELQVDEPRLVMGEMKDVRIERKKELRRLAKEFCEKLVQSKMDLYHNKLKGQQKVFEAELSEFEQWTAKMMNELNISEDEIKIED